MGLNETEAIILRTYNLAEADKVVVCLTQASGVVRAVAKGARKLKSRFGAGLEPFTIVSITYYEKEGRELLSLRQVEIIRSFFDLAKRTEVVAALAYMGELVLEFSPPHEPNEKIFRMVRAVLESLSTVPEQIVPLTRYFEIWILKLSGFLPDLTSCSACGTRFDENIRGYSTKDLRVLCGRCETKPGTRLSNEAFQYLRSAQKLSPKSFAEKARVELSIIHLNEMGSLTSALIRRALEREPRGQALMG